MLLVVLVFCCCYFALLSAYAVLTSEPHIIFLAHKCRACYAHSTYRTLHSQGVVTCKSYFLGKVCLGVNNTLTTSDRYT